MSMVPTYACEYGTCKCGSKVKTEATVLLTNFYPRKKIYRTIVVFCFVLKT